VPLDSNEATTNQHVRMKSALDVAIILSLPILWSDEAYRDDPMRYICVHGHFYQPPRENPSLEAIELQDSAYPYHDWNDRVCAECYGPNGSSRILNEKGEISGIVNNYAHMSFNFGPTLLSWIEEKAPKVYESILQADRQSQQRFGGHGSAIAQGYNHMILPLANRRDKVTQVKWGIADFEHRFKRKPEGMWLPETAVNTETLEVLAENGIQFTILSPRQAKRVRRRGGRRSISVTGSRIDPSRAYQVQLPSRKNINVFFYDGPISHAVAFERLLDDGKRFADRLVSGFSNTRTWPQLVHVATDGESYGHHHRYGEMALSSALQHIDADESVELTNYGQFLERFPPDHFAEIIDDSSWSCVHGIERWRTNCGCNSGGHAGWNQEWRGPLRASLDWLRDALAIAFEQHGGPLLKNPWDARNAYIRVILDRSDESLASFFGEHATHPLNDEERVRALKLLEMQRHALLMYTSCGWFFDELSGIESVQVIHYAGRAVRLAEECGGGSFEGEFVKRLSAAKSNLPEHGDGAQIYEKWVKPAYIDMPMLAGHYAISSLFENYEAQAQIYCYHVDRNDFAIDAEGKKRLATGTARFSSNITRESDVFTFAALYLGDPNLLGGVRFANAVTVDAEKSTLRELFSHSDTTSIIRELYERFNKQTFSLKSLFKDEQRKITEQILAESIKSTTAVYRSIYQTNAPLIRFLHALRIPIPPSLYSAAQIALNNKLEEALERTDPDANSIQGFLREVADTQVQIDTTTLEFVMRKRLEREAVVFAQHPDVPENVHRFKKLLDLALGLPFPVVLWEVQNISYTPLVQTLEKYGESNGDDDPAKIMFLSELASLRDALKIRGAGASSHATA
jgi:alpha-amylase/alpha-mannosidase (GH57 family)